MKSSLTYDEYYRTAMVRILPLNSLRMAIKKYKSATQLKLNSSKSDGSKKIPYLEELDEDSSASYSLVLKKTMVDDLFQNLGQVF
jgi:hypothetical protein